MQINRHLEIVYILLQKNTVTADALAERFGVSKRTIYRDIDTLSLAGIPVFTSKGRNGGISLLDNFVLNKSILNEEEQSEILAALKGLSAVKTDGADNALGKLSSVFKRNAVNWLEIDFSDWGINNSDIFKLLKTAILEKRAVVFDYYSSYGEKTHRKIEPLLLWFKDKSWYLRGFCTEKHDVRLFKLTRIKNAVLTDELFPDRGLIPERAEKYSDAGRPFVTLKLRIAPMMAYRVYDEFNENQVERHADGSYTATVTYPEDEWVYGFILSFGEYIDVLEPTRVRLIIKEKLKKTLQKYL